VAGPNGAGKTNLLEALHVGSQGFSPRTRAEGRLVRFGEAAARVRLDGSEGPVPVSTEVTVTLREPKRIVVNGAQAGSADELRGRLSALFFNPDRLAVVKGGPLVRRAYLDRMIGRVLPAAGQLPGEYARALAQRNESLRRVRAGLSSREATEPWTQSVAELGTELDAARAELVHLLTPGFAEAAESLGLEGAELGYEQRELTVAALEERLTRDLERGLTGMGPHLRDLGIRAGDRELRSFGSQGEQRATVLALILAEARLLAERRGSPPLLLLDDVLSELDAVRRTSLLAALPRGGQALVTATSLDAVPAGDPEPALVVVVMPGEARAA